MTNGLEHAFLEALQSTHHDNGLFLVPALCVLGILLLLALVFDGAIHGPNRTLFVRSSLLLCLASVIVCGQIASEMMTGTPSQRNATAKARLLAMILEEPNTARVLYDGTTAIFSTKRPTSVLGVQGSEEIEVALGAAELDAILLVLRKRGLAGTAARRMP